MMRGLLARIVREVWLTSLLFGAALMLVMALLTYVLPRVQEGLDEIFAQLPFVKTLITGLLGVDVGAEITAQTMQALLWLHPTVLAIIWTHEVILCTRMPAGEIDQGTIDVLLGLPVSRGAAYLSETLVWLLTGALVLLMGLVGHLIASPAMPAETRPAAARVVLVMVNLYCLYAAVGGVAFLVSALSERRGRAMATVFGMLLASFLLNFLASFWGPARQVAFLSVMRYYQPAQILRSGAISAYDIAVLLAVGGAAWLLGSRIFARRSICTV